MARTVKGPLAPAWQETPQSSSEAAGHQQQRQRALIHTRSSSGASAPCARSLASTLSRADWLAIQRRLQLSPQQGDIVRLMMTLPGSGGGGGGGGGNSNSDIALALTGERKARGILRSADQATRGTGTGDGGRGGQTDQAAVQAAEWGAGAQPHGTGPARGLRDRADEGVGHGFVG